MQYLVFRTETLSGADYQVSAHADAHPAGATLIGKLEGSSRELAAKRLQHVLREALMRDDAFSPGPPSRPAPPASEKGEQP